MAEAAGADYVAGRTPRAIERDLNRDKVSPPRGRQWNASTINGEASRGTGVIRRELYVGQLVWSKVRMVKDLDTGKRVSRPNPQADWQIVEVPDLAIIPREQFDAAQGVKRKKQVSSFQPATGAKTPVIWLAALRSVWWRHVEQRRGQDRPRACPLHRGCRKRHLPEPQIFYLDGIENSVLSALRTEMQSPAAIAEYVKTYTEERSGLLPNGSGNAPVLNGDLTRCGERLIG
jgi:hypothetical protein